MTLFRSKFRIETTRLKGFDYSGAGAYFVTICTRKKLQWFGAVENGAMNLSSIGQIIQEEWLKTPTIRSYISLDDWCIMPDHMHGILISHHHSMEPVETPRGGVSGFSIPTQNSDRRQGSSMPKEPRMFNETPPVSIETPPSIETSIETPPRGVSTQPGSKSPPKNWAPGSLGTIINQFKMSCTKRIRNGGFPEFSWQSRYHDRIIRSPAELAAIRKYIRTNPEHWAKETIPWDEDGHAWGL